jgi:predicted porin
MQKKIIAIAIAAGLSGAAFAQSSVTIYGIVDQSLEYGNYGDGSKAFLSGSGYATQRVGFDVVENLGNGLTAYGRLEASLNVDRGAMGTVQAGTTNYTGNAQAVAAATSAYAQVFDREAFVGLKGGFGAIKFGRNYSPAFNAAAAQDSFGVAGVGSNYHIAATTTRVNNSIRYESPNWSGFTGAVLFGLGDGGAGAATSTGVAATTTAPVTANNESAGGTTGINTSKNSGQHQSLNLAYANGPFNIIYGYSTNNSVTLVGTSVVKTKSNLLGGSYDFGMAKVTLGFGRYNDDAAVHAIDRRTWTLGGSFKVGAGTIRAQYSVADNKLAANNDFNHFALGYVHPISKRTTAYATWARTDNKEGSVAGAGAGATFAVPASAIVGSGANAADSRYDPSSIQFGVSHSF